MALGLEQIDDLHLSGKLYASVIVSVYNRIRSTKNVFNIVIASNN